MAILCSNIRPYYCHNMVRNVTTHGQIWLYLLGHVMATIYNHIWHYVATYCHIMGMYGCMSMAISWPYMAIILHHYDIFCPPIGRTIFGSILSRPLLAKSHIESVPLVEYRAAQRQGHQTVRALRPGFSAKRIPTTCVMHTPR